MVGQPIGEFEAQKVLGRAFGLKALALDRAVDDQLRQGQRQEIERLGGQRDRENHELIAARMLPNIAVERLMRCHALCRNRERS